MDDNIIICNVTEKDLAEIAKVHYAELPDDFCSLLGCKFLKNTFYPHLLSNKWSIGFCAKKNSELIGYIFFVKDEDYLTDIFKSNFFVFVYQMIKNCYKLYFLKYVFEIFLLLFIRNKSEIEKDFELGYIAVHSNHHNKGIGTMLLEHGISELRKMNTTYCWVKTLSVTPETIHFYKKANFKIYNEVLGRTYLFKEF